MIAVYGILLIVGSITLVIGAVYGRVLPFLTWLERFSPRAGVKVTGPKAADLLPRWSTGLIDVGVDRLALLSWLVGQGRGGHA